MIKQYGAIPYLKKDGGIKVVLITSASGYWIFPKGNLETHLGKRGTAELEAFEEAGVSGKVDPKRVYHTVVMIRGGRKAKLSLYPLAIEHVLDTWPEDSSRERIVVSLSKARKRIASDSLRDCIDALERDFSD